MRIFFTVLRIKYKTTPYMYIFYRPEVFTWCIRLCDLPYFLLLSLGPSKAPRNVIVHQITETTISLTWQPPEDEFLNGVLDKYVLTYQGKEHDRIMHVLEFLPSINRSLSHLQSADLVNLQENTTYAISIALFASGQMSPQVKIVERTLDTSELLYSAKLHTNSSDIYLIFIIL